MAPLIAKTAPHKAPPRASKPEHCRMIATLGVGIVINCRFVRCTAHAPNANATGATSTAANTGPHSTIIASGNSLRSPTGTPVARARTKQNAAATGTEIAAMTPPPIQVVLFSFICLVARAGPTVHNLIEVLLCSVLLSSGDESEKKRSPSVPHQAFILALSAMMKPYRAAPHPIPLANKPMASTVLTCADEKRDRPTLPKKTKIPTKKMGFTRSMTPRLPHRTEMSQAT